MRSTRLLTEIEKIGVELRHKDDRERAEITKLVAEAGHVRLQTWLSPFLAAGAVIGATAAVVKIFFAG